MYINISWNYTWYLNISLFSTSLKATFSMTALCLPHMLVERHQSPVSLQPVTLTVSMLIVRCPIHHHTLTIHHFSSQPHWQPSSWSQAKSRPPAGLSALTSSLTRWRTRWEVCSTGPARPVMVRSWRESTWSSCRGAGPGLREHSRGQTELWMVYQVLGWRDNARFDTHID